MIQTISVDPDLAELVDRELHLPKVCWQYMPITTKYYQSVKDPQILKYIEQIDKNYGPIVDTQRFTDEFYNAVASRKNESKGIKSFADIRNDPNHRYNRSFPFTSNLVNQLQQKYIPTNFDIIRLMVNMQTIRPKWSLLAPHPDYTNKENITILYYVNNSDGDTYLFDKGVCIHRFSPVRGTAAIYPSYMMHAGSTPIKTETRVVINMCFGLKPS